MSDPLFVAAERKVAYESIVEQVERAIADGRLKPGDRLPGERQLMESFGVSRSTVREALRVLQATGSITSRHGDPRGSMVIRYSPDLLTESIQRFARADASSIAELLQFRLSLESTACRLAARLHTEDDVAQLDEALAAMRDAAEADNEFAFWETNRRFDDTLALASHNQMIRVCGNAVAELMRGIELSRFSTDPDRQAHMRSHVDAAAAIVAAIRKGDPVEAAALVQQATYIGYAELLNPEEDEQMRALVFGSA